jgi:hypothetical protein
MTDYISMVLYGFSTGTGVVLATKLVNWLDRHPITVKFKKTVDDIVSLNGKKNN